MATTDLWTGMSSHDSVTENGAVTHSTSGDELVNFFFTLGALRGADTGRITNVFSKAFFQDNELALKALFYARDVRGGQGERDVFKASLSWLAEHRSELVLINLDNIVKFGRWSDLLSLMGTSIEAEVISFWAMSIKAKDGLACKWAPREKSTHRKVATLLRKELDMSPKQYRKWLSAHTSVVETQMCAQDWDEIQFSSVPSRAMKIYRSAFERNSKTFKPWVDSLVKGEVKVNSKTLYPHEIVRDTCSYSITHDQKSLLQAMWEQLPDYFDGSTRSVLPIIDVSGSMDTPVGGYGSGNSTKCMDVAVGLGMYCAERTRGPFRGKFVTFHSKPTLINIPNTDFYSRVQDVKRAPWGGTTNFQATFDLILNTAVRNKLSQSDLPDVVLCVSDMEFNVATGSGYYSQGQRTNFEVIKRKFKRAGYKVPQLVFWNVQSRSDGNVPVKFDDNGVALVSGFSPSIMKMILSSDELTPRTLMLDTLNSERYATVRVP